MTRNSDSNVRKIIGTAAFALAMPTAVGAATATGPLLADTTTVSNSANKRGPRQAEERESPELFPLKLRPALNVTRENAEKAIQVKVMDAEGRRILLARAHGNIVLGPLPAGEYKLQLCSGGDIEEHAMKLGVGKRGLLRYQLGA